MSPTNAGATRHSNSEFGTDPVNYPVNVEALLVERDELLKSIEDLGRERDAGDMDDVDYQTLLDSYTVRAADVLRALNNEPTVGADGGVASRSDAAGVPPKRAWRTLVVGGGIAAFGVVAGIVVARSAGERVGSTGLTGSVRSASGARQAQIDSLMTTARDSLANDPITALTSFDQVRELDPENVEAITYGGWLVRNVGRSATDPTQTQELLTAAIKRIDEAIRIDPSYPDALAFRAIIYLRDQNDATSAVALFDRLDKLNPPEQITTLTSAAETEARSAAAAAGAAG